MGHIIKSVDIQESLIEKQTLTPNDDDNGICGVFNYGFILCFGFLEVLLGLIHLLQESRILE